MKSLFFTVNQIDVHALPTTICVAYIIAWLTDQLTEMNHGVKQPAKVKKVLYALNFE